MGYNYCQGQLVGPFEPNEELYNRIKADAAIDFSFISHIGIQTETGNIVLLNDKEFEIGKTGIYEIGNTVITSIKFKETNTHGDTVIIDKNTIIDYIIVIE